MSKVTALENVIDDILNQKDIDLSEYLETCVEEAKTYIKEELARIDEPIDITFSENNKKHTWVMGELEYKLKGDKL